MAGCSSGASAMSSFRKAASRAWARRLRRLPWSDARLTAMSRYSPRREQFERFEELAAGPMAGALIVTAEIGAAISPGSTVCGGAIIPPERNHLPAHLTMFHALPPSAEAELRDAPRSAVSEAPPPPASIAGLMDLGGGVAFRIVSPDLDAIRGELAERSSRLARRAGRGGLAAARHDPEQGCHEDARALCCKRLASADSDRAPLAISRPWACTAISAGRGRRSRRYPFRGVS